MCKNKYKVTPSLFSAYYWYRKLESSSKEDFLKVLKREPIEQTPLMLKGIDFENEIEKQTHSKIKSGNEVVDIIADIVRGGEWQKPITADICGWSLVGRMDVFCPDQKKVYDIKYAKAYDLGKYKYSIQHLVYLYCCKQSGYNIQNFDYLVYSESDKWYYTESYNWDEKYVTQLLIQRLEDMTRFIFADPDLANAYRDNWVV